MALSDPTTRPSYVELAAVIAVGALHVVIEVTRDLDVSRVYNVLALTACLAYLVWRLVTTKNLLHIWGFRADNFWPALGAQLLFFVPASVAVLAVGWLRGNLSVPRTFWLVCALYPFFGIAQQFVLQNLIVCNLRGLIRPDLLCALVAALLFSLSHLPRISLSAAAFVGGVFITLIYRRHPNTWAAGIVHGLLAALVFYLLLGEDPGARILQLFGRAAGVVGAD